MPAVLHIDVFFDLICPWCLIGKAHLRRARAQLGQFPQSDPPVDVQVNWRAVQLVPNVPDSGWPFSEFFERRLGGRDAVRARQSQDVEATGRGGRASAIARHPRRAAFRIQPAICALRRPTGRGAAQRDTTGNRPV